MLAAELGGLGVTGSNREIGDLQRLPPTGIQALWATGRFDTVDIARLLGVAEPQVERLARAAGEVLRCERAVTAAAFGEGAG